MTDLVLVLQEAPNWGLSRSLRTHRYFHATELETGYHLYDWLNDKRVAREEHQFILQLATQSPFLPDFPVNAFDDRGVSVTFRGQEYASFFAAVSLSMPTVSLCHNDWDQSSLDITYTTLTGEGEIVEKPDIVRNVARPKHYQTHASWISDRNRSVITDGRQLWDEHSRQLDRLVFCTGVPKQVCALDRSDSNFSHIVDRLFDLQAYCTAWKSGAFEPDDLPNKCNSTSRETLQQYEMDYTFVLPNATPIVCGWHFYLPRRAWRIYFAPDAANRRIVVGHIGEHLPTKTKYT